MHDADITLALERAGRGDSSASEDLLRLVYGELRQLAAAKLARERPGQTLQPTALVHEAWLRIAGDGQPLWNGRGHFFGAAAEGMRRILIEKARRKSRLRHGGDMTRVAGELQELEIEAPTDDDDELLLVSEALDSLAVLDPRKAELVKHRYFAGLTLEEAADVMGLSPRTAKRDWAYAKGWLYNEVKRLRR